MQERLNFLFQRCHDQTATSEEREEFLALAALPEYEQALNELLEIAFAASKNTDEPGEQTSREILSAIFDAQKRQVERVKALSRVTFLKKTWFRYAAAVVILFGIGAYLWTSNKNADQMLTGSDKSLQTVIGPGGDKAILTLADGTRIILDNAANGNLAQQGNTQVLKLANGKIAYNVNDVKGEMLWNVMSTPVGGQYHVTLPDGTKVWLNAASSITYPVAFVDKNRQVKITGEVYFEVTKNKEKPFIVDIDGKSTVEVLGTSFNINSYVDEGSIKTTLIEGSVKMAQGDLKGLDPTSMPSVILKPGQQAMMVTSSDQQSANPASVTIKSDADIDQILAWKNGLFNFNGSDFRSMMRQLERWYDIKVQYQGTIPNIVFEGEMYRNVNLSDVLEMFQKMGIRLRMNGRTLLITE